MVREDGYKRHGFLFNSKEHTVWADHDRISLSAFSRWRVRKNCNYVQVLCWQFLAENSDIWNCHLPQKARWTNDFNLNSLETTEWVIAVFEMKKRPDTNRRHLEICSWSRNKWESFDINISFSIRHFFNKIHLKYFECLSISKLFNAIVDKTLCLIGREFTQLSSFPGKTNT